MTQEWWHDEIAPITERLRTLYGELLDALVVMRPEDRLRLRAAASLAGQANCSWFEHDAAELINAALPSMDWLLREAGRVPDWIHKDRAGALCGDQLGIARTRWAGVTCPDCLAQRSKVSRRVSTPDLASA